MFIGGRLGRVRFSYGRKDAVVVDLNGRLQEIYGWNRLGDMWLFSGARLFGFC